MDNLFYSNCENSFADRRLCNGCGVAVAADVSNPTPVSSGVDSQRRRVGPRPAKRSSPDDNRISLYIHRNILDAVRVWLSHQGLESSVLFERLLATWMVAKTPREVKIG